MRMSTVNLITFYTTLGAILNALLIFILVYVDACIEEKFFTICVCNAIFVMVARDFSKAHEISCKKKRIST